MESIDRGPNTDSTSISKDFLTGRFVASVESAGHFFEVPVDEIQEFTDESVGHESRGLLERRATSTDQALPRMTAEEYGVVYSAKFDHMVGQLCRNGVDRDRAQDLVQDAWTNCWERRHQLRDLACLSGWVMVSAIRGAYSRAKRERRLIQWPDEFQPVSSAGIDYDALDVHLAIEKLPRLQKQLIEMFLRGLRGEEIASELKTTLDGVYTRSARARNALRTALDRGDRKTPTATTSRRRPSKQKQARQA